MTSTETASVTIWWTNRNVAVSPAALSDAERGRWERLRDPISRQRFLAGHVMLRSTVAAAAGVSPRSLVFLREDCPTCGAAHGRPYCPDLGGFEFSYSSSGDLACVALSSTRVGVDVEAPVAPDAIESVLPELHPEEIADINRANGIDFTRVWTRKEAYLKALGTGLSRSLSQEYLGQDLARHPTDWTLIDIVLDGIHTASLCCPANRDLRVDTRFWSPNG